MNMDDYMKTEKYIRDLIPLYLGGELSVEERKIIEDWMAADKENLKFFLQTKSIWESAAIAQDYNPDIESRWQSLQQRLGSSKNKSHHIISILKIAASFLIFFMVGITTYHFFIQSKQKSTDELTNKIMAPYGSKTMLTLSDGSTVWLNAGSVLEYPDNFMAGDSREVILEGEAYFNIAKNDHKPFNVNAQGVIVKAIGTSFNVKAYSDEPLVEATLVEGIISVSTGQMEENEIILKPRQKLTIDKGSSEYSVKVSDVEKESKLPKKNNVVAKIKKSVEITSDVETEVYTSWKDARWIIQNEQLDKLAKKLERRYAIEIAFDDTLLKQFRFTGTLHDESLEQVLEVISFAAPIKYKINGNKVVLEDDPKLKHKYDSYE